ncbi:hypothetical protein MAPG_04722 [Magnaporthiopsis poae ATCC 64411]|uniref:Uncharacterized protein n=1 Tax=Magnaporthiopsis poae (strain ATCC 64411 / 73-15) TaxID=644358 RepID=A0A0C4DXG9_MAGP6|nr:hypothetical protein MAPG_04722 [Magnaporthiopsis poae ATCC 64411]
MCTYYYLHYHHLAPCTRPIDIALSYAFCQDATSIISSSEQQQTTAASTAAGSRTSSSSQQQQQQQQPCQELYFDPSHSPAYRKRKSPDTFCYHTCCHNCTRDAAATGGGGDGAVA